MKKDLISIRFFVIFFALVAGMVGQSASAADTSLLPPDNKGTKATVEDFFSDAPQMISVAACESSFQQYTAKGTTFTGAGGRYVGVFQIAKDHVASASKLGFDIYTLAGNLDYAKYMYESQGLDPWKGCVRTASAPKTTKAKKSVPSVADSTTSTPQLTKNLGSGDVSSEVVTIQKILNNAGYYVAHSGPGSLGKETNSFGPGTVDALKRFQCIKNIACQGGPSSTGYGYAGPTTRIALLKEAAKPGL